MPSPLQENSIFSKVRELYFSIQFLRYLFCGVVSTIAQIIARYIFSNYFSFSVAVFLAYFVSMATALFLYRAFVFEARGGTVARQVFLFTLGYLAFLPVTLGVSVVSENPLRQLFDQDTARFVAHLFGVSLPVVLNFAFNKLVTFRSTPRVREIAP